MSFSTQPFKFEDTVSHLKMLLGFFFFFFIYSSLTWLLSAFAVEKNPISSVWGRSAQAFYLMQKDGGGAVFLIGKQNCRVGNVRFWHTSTSLASLSPTVPLPFSDSIIIASFHITCVSTFLNAREIGQGLLLVCHLLICDRNLPLLSSFSFSTNPLPTPALGTKALSLSSFKA